MPRTLEEVDVEFRNLCAQRGYKLHVIEQLQDEVETIKAQTRKLKEEAAAIEAEQKKAGETKNV